MKPILINDNLYLDVVQYLMVIVGMWNYKNIRYFWLRYIYRVYSYIPITYMVIFVTWVVIHIPVMVRRNQLHDLVHVVSLMVSYVVIIMKVCIFSVKKLIAVEGVSESCSWLASCPDLEVRRMFTSNVKHALVISVYYWTAVFVVCYSLAFGNWYHYSVVYPRDLWNSTDKPYPLPCWLPFDPEVYYGWALTIQVTGVHIGGYHYVCLQSIMLGLVWYVSGQLHILQHCFRNFQRYARQYSQLYEVPRDVAARRIMKCLIKWHQNIIRFNTDLNDSLNYILLAELLLNSILIASLLFQITNIVIDSSLPFAVSYSVLMLSHIFILFWHTDEIMVNSMGIADALMEGDWHEEDIWVQKCILIILIRSQRPLTITCGPFSAASVEHIIIILKASYSYAMLMMR